MAVVEASRALCALSVSLRCHSRFIRRPDLTIVTEVLLPLQLGMGPT